jgi:hypothetical protein
MTTLVTATTPDGKSLTLSGDAEFGYRIYGLGFPSLPYEDLVDAMEDFSGFVVARTQESQEQEKNSCT